MAKLFMNAKGFDYNYHNTPYYYGYLDMLMEILTNNPSGDISRHVADIFTQYGMFIIMDLMKHVQEKGGDLVKFINRQHKEGDGMSPFHRIIYRGIFHDLRCFGTGHGYNKFTFGENTRIGYYDLVNHFIESGADIELPVLQDPKRKITPYVEGLYPIHLAARICNGVIPITDADGNPEYQGILNQLVAHDVDIFKKSLPSQHTIREVYNKTALHFACDPYFDWFNDYSIEATAYHKINPSAYPPSQGGDSVMRHRLEYAEENVKFLLEIQEDILKAALTKGEELERDNLNAVDSENYTPLMVASREIMFPPRVYKILLDGETYTLGEPTALDIYDNTGEDMTALFLLLSNLPIKREHEKSIDIISQSDNRLSKIYYLLESGANTALKNQDGMTPLDIAVKQESENAIASLVPPGERKHGLNLFQAAKQNQRRLENEVKKYSIDESSLVYPELPKSVSIQTISPDHVIRDPITLDEKTIKEILDDPVDNLIFCDQRMETFSYVARQKFIQTLGINDVGDGSSIKYECVGEEPPGVPNESHIKKDLPYVNIAKTGLYGAATGALVLRDEFAKKILVYPERSSSRNVVFMIVNTDRKIGPLADAEVVYYETIPGEGPVNVFGDEINIVSADHCQKDAYRVDDDGNQVLIPMPSGTLASIKLIPVKKPPEKPPALAESKFYGDFEDSEADASAGPGKPTAISKLQPKTSSGGRKKRKTRKNKKHKKTMRRKSKKMKTRKNYKRKKTKRR